MSWPELGYHLGSFPSAACRSALPLTAGRHASSNARNKSCLYILLNVTSAISDPWRRLQPSAVVTDEDCAACDFNRPGKTCLRKMEWVWRGETYAASTSEYYSIKNQLQARQTGSVHKGLVSNLEQHHDRYGQQADNLTRQQSLFWTQLAADSCKLSLLLSYCLGSSDAQCSSYAVNSADPEKAEVSMNILTGHTAAKRTPVCRAALQSEMFPPAVEGGVPRSYVDMPIDERSKLLKERLKKYCQKARLHPPHRSHDKPYLTGCRWHSRSSNCLHACAF